RILLHRASFPLFSHVAFQVSGSQTVARGGLHAVALEWRRTRSSLGHGWFCKLLDLNSISIGTHERWEKGCKPMSNLIQTFPRPYILLCLTTTSIPCASVLFFLQPSHSSTTALRV